MAIEYRLGTLEECAQIVQCIDEFEQKESIESLSYRLKNKQHLIQIAVENGQLLGFKIGYELDKGTFYSWLGGVLAMARNKGIAQKLLEHQEAWVKKNHYLQLKVKSRNQFPNMLCLLIKNGYIIENYEKMPNVLESRIHFVKQLS
ncbi:N-acetyltransferase [Vibrio zhanjiangensis]|uniref:N-acetyltransferase n=1 Tax=Vibrio zhanjiangensis TaxID=1046128 RepID=A0ABQ6F2K6_9VIBR|nr:GNAT family N-acetyltransferase [Vibrio zhanjiangensis]GLT18942.1 N-acetyltransferase [Vibrio zhanjiangensis]